MFGSGEAETRSVSTTLANPDSWLVDSFGTSASTAGQRVSVSRALGLSGVFSAVKLISETVGMLPLKVYKDLGDRDRVEARSHRCWGMLHDAPNPLQPAHRFWSTAVAHYLLWGNIYIEKLRGQLGLVEELWLLDPALTSVQWDPNSRTKRYVQERFDGRKIWGNDEVLHIPAFSTDGIVGKSPIAVARESLGTALARETFEGHFYQRGGVLPGVLTHPGNLSEDAQKRLKESFRKVLASNQWAVLEEGLTANPLSMPLQDMQFVESKNLTTRDIANIFNLPVSFLNGSSGDSLTYATVESNQIQFTQITIAPIVNALAKALALDPSIFPQNAWFPEFVIDGIHRGDMKSRVEYYEKMAGIKALTRNEIRALENLPPVAGGDDFAQQPQPPPAAADTNANGQAPQGAFSLPATQGADG
jgi:HK97 family phage portal protein